MERFLQAMSLPDEADRLSAVTPLVHASLLTSDGSDFSWNYREFHYEAALASASGYLPLEVVEVHRGSLVTLGLGATAERGRVDKYFLRSIGGRRAPVHVFFPESGGPPLVVNFSSL
ncbi:MAG: hypothetical protein AB1758_11485 [Candidatus Eremiobacterota bacterium]